MDKQLWKVYICPWWEKYLGANLVVKADTHDEAINIGHEYAKEVNAATKSYIVLDTRKKFIDAYPLEFDDHGISVV